ncbi:MAG: sulfur carrier protein ThiS [Clostridia bacterium]|nr:MAG: sulfur carrier protein ThiS [Clostridia bacterium]
MAVQILVNGRAEVLHDPVTVQDYLNGKGLSPHGLAVQRNGEILARDSLATTWLADNDRLELIRIVGGG